jgi:hypothetical protein
MSNSYQPIPPTTGASETSTAAGTADVAKEHAQKVASATASAGENVVGTAKSQAANVAGEAKTQAKDLLAQTQGELRDQAGAQQQRVASGLHSLSEELGSMARNSEGSGIASDLVQQVSTRAGSVASWLEDRDPGSLLDEVRTFARTRPGTFIGLAAVAGVVAGRLTRSLTSAAADAKDEAASRPQHVATPEPVSTYAPPTGTYPTDASTIGLGGTVTSDVTTGPPPAVYTDAVDPVEEADAYGLHDTSVVDGEPYLRNQRP